MKKHLIILLGVLSFSMAHAQYCWENVNTISTTPGAPGSINTFDWTQEFATVYLMDEYNPSTGSTPPRQITLPMYTQGSGSVFNNLNLTDMQAMAPDLKDHKPADGWELLVKEFGLPAPKDKNVENPFFALYNRYSGKIRVFFMLTSKSASLSLTGAYLELSFINSPRRTALLQHINPIGKPVVFLETQNSMRVPNYLDNRDYYWFYADFPAAYDPCTCNMPENSRLTVRLIANEDAQIDAKINGSLYQNAVVSTQPGSPDKSIGMSNLLDGNEQKLLQGAQKAFESYKTYDGYRENFVKAVGQLDDYYINIINKQIEKKYPTGVTLNNVTVAPNVNALKQSSDGVKFLQGANYNANDLKGLKTVASAIPYVGAVIGIVDFFMSMDKAKQQQATAQPTPLNFSVDLNLHGTIKKTNPITSYSFITPGTKTGPPGNGIPDYNNILGVVNILDIPPLEYVEYTPQAPSWNPYSLSDIYPPTREFIPNIRQYRLSDDIKYVVNPASDLEVISAEAAYILEFGSDSASRPVIFTEQRRNSAWRDVDQMPVEFGKTPADPNLSVPERMENAGWETDYISKGFFDYMTNGSTGPKQGKYRIRTPYAPLQCLRNVAFNLFNHIKEDTTLTSNDVCCRNKPPAMILKVVFKLRRKDQTNDDVTTMILSYDLSKMKQDAKKAEGFNDLHYNLERYTAPTYAYYPHSFVSQPVFPTVINAPGTVVLQDQVIHGNFFARDTIIIKKGVLLAHDAHLYAGKLIITDVNAPYIFSPAYGFSTLNIGKTLTCNADIRSMEETKENIRSKCNSETYRNRALTSSTEEKKISYETIAMANDFFIYPNPTQDKLNIRYLSQQPVTATVAIYDVTGRKLFEEAGKVLGDTPYQVDVKNYTPGVYILSITNTSGLHQVYKFVKQ